MLRYISYKIGDEREAEDMAQDVFLKLICYDVELVWESIRSLLYRISANLVNDYWRRRYVKVEVDRYVMETTAISGNVTEETVVGNELEHQERKCLAKMARKRRMIYERRRFFGETAQEIAESMNLSRRTVENHLFLGYKEMRHYIKACC